MEPTSVPKCPKQVHQPQHNHGRLDHGLKCRIDQFLLVKTVPRLVGSIRIPHLAVATLAQKGQFTRDKGTQMTLLVNIIPDTTLTQSNLSVSSAVVNPLFSSISKRAGDSFAASGSATQKPVHCTAMVARKIDRKSADMNYHAVPPPDYNAGGHSKREELCQQDPHTFTMSVTGA